MRRGVALLLASIAATAAAEDPDAAALALADQAPASVQHPGDWKVFAEAALVSASLRYDEPTQRTRRLSLDAHYDGTVAPGWRTVFADRVDTSWRNPGDDDSSVNTLKEAYVSWQPIPERIVDAGRINARYGVATGYNPTDYFRVGAIRSVVSADPASLRENRLGSAMLRGQTLWNGGSLTALYSPKVDDEPNARAFSPDWGATNNRDRWLIVGSQRLSEHIDPQWLIFGEQHESPQFGLNLTALVNDATVAYLEWSGGRSASLLAQALNLPDDTAFRHRVATGLSYTMPNKLSVTAEYQYNDAALGESAWNALGQGSPAAYWQYRGFVQSRQDTPTKNAVFLYGKWQDAALLHLDMAAMARIDSFDHSRMTWLEARYHWERIDLALQWQRHRGDAASEYGALPEKSIGYALVTIFL
jgi:hypothetical protein